MGHPVYHLELDVRHCRAELRLNDMPLISLTSHDPLPVTFAPPINPFLVGELNIIDVEILPLVDDAGVPTSTFWDAKIEGNVRRFEKDDIFAPGAGDVVTEFTIPDELIERVREEELELPQHFSHIFSNEVIDFSGELSDAPPFHDRDALLDYAVHLRDLTAAGNVAGMLAEMDAKIQVWVAAYDETYEAFADSLREELESFFAERPITDFERDQIELRSCCGGRLWELMKAPGLPLLQTGPDAAGGTTQLPIIVGLRDAALRVVR